MRRRILLLVVGMTVLVVLAFSIPIAVLIRSTTAQNAQNATLDQARSAVSFLRSYPTKATVKTYVAQQSSSTGRPMSIALSDGTVVGSTPTDGYAPSGSLSRRFPGGGAPSGNGSDTDNSGEAPGGGGGGAPQAQLVSAPDGKGGQLALAFAPSPDGSPYVVRVYLSEDALHSGEVEKYLLLTGAVLLLIVVGVVAGEVLTRRIVRPLAETATTAQRLSAGDVTARAPTDGPVEVADVGRALNRLADRIDQLIAEERETVADLSHRLRTPLTAMRLDAEALRDNVEAERMGTHVSTLERMLTALIHAARRPQREGRLPSSDATEVVADRVAFWSVLAEDQSRSAALDLPSSPLIVRAGAEDLAAAVDALLENVIAHTPEGTAFAVRLVADGTGARLDVSDDGPGLPDDASVRGRSDRGSSGLGLSIARRCAEASGGSMTLGRSSSGGALVTLLLHAP